MTPDQSITMEGNLSGAVAQLRCVKAALSIGIEHGSKDALEAICEVVILATEQIALELEGETNDLVAIRRASR